LLAIDAPARRQLRNSLCTNADIRRLSAPQASASIGGRFFPSFAIVAKVSPALAVDEADDQRRNGKHAHNATEYHDQPNSPATVVLNNLKG